MLALMLSKYVFYKYAAVLSYVIHAKIFWGDIKCGQKETMFLFKVACMEESFTCTIPYNCDLIKGNIRILVKMVMNSYVLHCFWISKNVCISAIRYLIEMEIESKCSILNGQVIYIKKWKKLVLPTCESFLLIVSHLHQ